MSAMQIFHKSLSAPIKRDTYRKALIALTKVSPAQLSAITKDLAWQSWSPEKLKPTNA